MRKKGFVLLFVLLSSVGLSAQNLEAGLNVNGVMLSGSQGFAVQPELSWLFDAVGTVTPSAGLSIIYQKTASDSHSEIEWYGLARGSVDWDLFSMTSLPSSFQPMASRLQNRFSLKGRLELGGGYLKDTAIELNKTSNCGGFVVFPSAGCGSFFDNIAVELLCGPQWFITSRGTKTAFSVNLGASYLLDIAGGKE